MSHVSLAQKFHVGSIDYHTGVFEWKKNTAMAVVGFAALTALVVGILALLHVNAGQIPTASIPTQVGLGMTITGGVMTIGDLIALAIFLSKHSNVKKQMEQQLVNDEKTPWHSGGSQIKKVLKQLEGRKEPHVAVGSSVPILKGFFVIAQKSESITSLHIFSEKALMLHYLLDKEGKIVDAQRL